MIETDAHGNDRLREFSQQDATRGKLAREQLFADSAAAGQIVRETTSLWHIRSSLGRTQVYLAEQRVEDPAAYTDDPPPAQCVVTRNEPPDDYGRVTTTCSLACGGGSAGQCAPAAIGQVETWTTWAMPEAGSHVYDRPAHVETVHYLDVGGPTAQVLVRKDFFYDQLGAGAVTRGNVHRVSSEIGASLIGLGGTADVLTAHDAFGNVTSVTDPSGNETQLIFTGGPFELYPVVEWQTSGPQLQVSRATDLRFGKPTQLTDENGAVSLRTYDSLGRVLCEAGPEDDCISDPTVTYDYRYGDPQASSFEGKLSFVELRRTDPHATGGVVVSTGLRRRARKAALRDGAASGRLGDGREHRGRGPDRVRRRGPRAPDLRAL